MSKYTPLILYIATLFTAIFLAIGSFLGKANDPQLSGMYWLLVAIYMVFPVFDGN